MSSHVTPDEVAIEQRRQRVAEMYVRGYRQSEIAETLGVSQPTIHRDIKAVRTGWLDSSIRDYDALQEQELQKLDALEQEAWDAWRRSQAERVKTVTEKTEGSTSGRAKAQQTKESSYGDPRFLATIATCIDRRCKILGVEAPVKIDAKTEHSGVGFDEIVKLARQLVTGEKEDASGMEADDSGHDERPAEGHGDKPTEGVGDPSV